MKKILFLTSLFLYFMTSNEFNPLYAQESLYAAYIESVACKPSPPSVQLQNTYVVSQADESFLMRLAWPCAKGVLLGAWDATGGLIVGAGKCLSSPFECTQKAQQAFNNAYDFFKDVTKNVSQAFSAVSNLPPEEKSKIICSIIGELGTDVILAILTAGAGSVKFAATITKNSLKLKKLAKIAGSVKSNFLSKLAKLEKHLIDKVDDIISSGYGDEVADLLKKVCPI